MCVCVWMCVGVHTCVWVYMPWHAWRGQKATLWILSSPSTLTWFLGTDHQAYQASMNPHWTISLAQDSCFLEACILLFLKGQEETKSKMDGQIGRGTQKKKKSQNGVERGQDSKWSAMLSGLHAQSGPGEADLWDLFLVRPAANCRILPALRLSHLWMRCLIWMIAFILLSSVLQMHHFSLAPIMRNNVCLNGASPLKGFGNNI